MPAESPTNEDIQAVMLAAMKKVRADVANPDEASALDDDIARLEEGPVDMGETGWAVMRETAKGLAALSASPVGEGLGALQAQAPSVPTEGHGAAVVGDYPAWLNGTAQMPVGTPEWCTLATDKIEGLTTDLRMAVQVAWRRGAKEWARLNYPDWAQWLEACDLASTTSTAEQAGTGITIDDATRDAARRAGKRLNDWITDALRKAAKQVAPSPGEGDAPVAWRHPSTLPHPKYAGCFFAAIRVSERGGPPEWQVHLIALDDETHDVHPNYNHGWRWEDYELWTPCVWPAAPDATRPTPATPEGAELHLRAFRDGLRIYLGNVRVEGPWSWSEASEALAALAALAARQRQAQESDQ